MKNTAEVLVEKERALQTVRRQVEALRIVAPLLDDMADVPKIPPQFEGRSGLRGGQYNSSATGTSV